MYGFWIHAEDSDDLMDSWGYMLDALGIEYWVRGETYLRRQRKDAIPDWPVVMVTSKVATIPGTVDLADFVHPAECLYWFGGSHVTTSEEPLNVIAKVYIAEHEMHSPQAGAIVAWDRRVKGG